MIGGADSPDGMHLEFIDSAEVYGAAGSSGISNAQVWVRIGDAPETNFATGQFCGGTDCAAPWIQGNGWVYTFTL